MGDEARNRFERELFSIGQRTDAIVLDIRDNNGGDTHDSLLKILARNRNYFTFAPRTEPAFPQPERAWTKPVVLLTNGGLPERRGVLHERLQGAEARQGGRARRPWAGSSSPAERRSWMARSSASRISAASRWTAATWRTGAFHLILRWTMLRPMLRQGAIHSFPARSRKRFTRSSGKAVAAHLN